MPGHIATNLPSSGGGVGNVFLTDNADSSDLHGLIPGQTYTFTCWIYIPSGSFAAADIGFQIFDYTTLWLATTVHPSAVYDAWQEVTVTRTIRSLATGAFVKFYTPSDSGKTFYVDDISVLTDSSDKVVLHPWHLSPTSGIVLAFGHGYIHFYKDGAPILSGGTPYSKTTTYTLSELSSIRVRQVTSYAYITCPGHKEAKLTRVADDNWTLADVTNTAGAGEQDFSTDYPALVEEYEDRLLLAKTPLHPDRSYGSKVAIYENFTLGTTWADAWDRSNGIFRNNEIMWIVAGECLLVGTSNGIYRMGGREAMLTSDVAWWPNIQSSVGSSDVPALMVDDFVAFVGKGGRHIYRFQFDQAVNQYVSDPITQLAEHRAKHIIGMVHQRNPESILWAWTSDGQLLSGSYSRSTMTIGWSRHDLGGNVESMCVIPTNVEDQVWVVVAREIGGTTVRHIEYFAAREWEYLEDYHGVDDAVVVDNGTEKTVTSISKADPAVCTAVLHGFSNDDKVRFAGVTGITAVNGTVYTVKSKTDNTFQLYNEAGSAAIDFSGQASAGSGGTVEKVSKTMTLAHLPSTLVKTWGDGARVADETTDGSGVITLDSYCNKIRTGLPFTTALEPMPVSEVQNKLKRITGAFLRFFKTADAQIGPDSTHMVDVTFEYPDAFYTDGGDEDAIASNAVDCFSQRDATLRIESSDPGPCTITSLTLELGEIER